MYYVINHRTSQLLEVNTDKFPLFENLPENFAWANDTLELIEKVLSVSRYKGLKSAEEKIVKIKRKLVNAEGTDYYSAQEIAVLWLQEKTRNVIGKDIPYPKCERCSGKMEYADIRSIADTGLCWDCRTPKRKKKEKVKIVTNLVDDFVSFNNTKELTVANRL